MEAKMPKFLTSTGEGLTWSDRVGLSTNVNFWEVMSMEVIDLFIEHFMLRQHLKSLAVFKI